MATPSCYLFMWMISSLLATINPLLTNSNNNSTLNLNARTLDLSGTSLASMYTAIEPRASYIYLKNTIWSLCWFDWTCHIAIQARSFCLLAFDLFRQQILSLQYQNIAHTLKFLALSSTHQQSLAQTYPILHQPSPD